MPDGGLITLFLAWLADKVGGTILSEKFKQRFLKPGPSKTDLLIKENIEALKFYSEAKSREDKLLAMNARLSEEILRLKAENAGLIRENERLQRGLS